VVSSSLGLRHPPLALRNVSQGGRKSLAAISGAAFSLTMVLLQLGFLQAVRITATNNFDQLDFDVVLLSSRYEQFYAPGFLPVERLRQARSVDTVISATPLYASFGLWRCPPYPLDPSPGAAEAESPPGPLSRWLAGARIRRPLQRRELFVLGFDLDHPPFRPPIQGSIEAARPLLRLRDRVLMNELSHPDFGWQLRDQYKDWELGGRAVTIVGGFRMLRGFAADATVLCSDLNFVRLCGYGSTETTNFGLLKVRPGSIDATVRELRTILPIDVQALSRREVLAREDDHWVNQTSTGKLFAFGVLVAMVVAAVVVYQVLSNDVREHLPEYATLKAMGYSTSRLASIVVAQSLIYMGISFFVGVLIAIIVYKATQELAGIPMRMTMENLGVTLLLAVVVGVSTGLLTIGRLRRADPAELF
jgi:putative ABC transport system permease protein